MGNSNYNNGNGNNNQQQVNYNNAQIYVPHANSALNELVVATSGFVERINFFNRKQADGEKECCGITVKSTLGDSKVRRNFGEEFVRPDHKVTFKTVYSGYSCENIKRMGLKEGDCVQIMVHSLEKEEGTSDKGYAYRNLKGFSSDDLVRLHRSKDQNNGNGNAKNGNDYGQSAPAQQGYKPAPQQNQGYAPTQQNQGYAPTQQNQGYAPTQQAANAQGYQQVPSGWDAPHAESYVPNAAPTPAAPARSAPYQAPSQQAPAQQYAPQQPVQNGLVCTCCGAPVDQKVADYSQRKFGRILCRTCQTNANGPTAPAQNAAPAAPVQQGYQQNASGYGRLGDLFEDLSGTVDEGNPFNYQ